MTLPRERLRKHKFTDAELDILLEEVTRHEDALFGLQGNCLTTREKYKIWFEITERVCSASGIQRTINDVKRRWQDLKRRTKAKVVDARRHVPRDGSTSSLSQLPDDGKGFDAFSIHTVIKDEEQNSTACNLPEDLFLDTDSVSPETSLPPAVLGSFEQQLLRAHREHTAALREGFRSLTRQNRLLYREMCETNKNVARIASRIAEKNDSVSDVAEELMGIQHKISESIDTTNCLQDRVIDLLASYQERPLIVMPNSRRDARPMEEDNAAYKADH
ncbi:hypothetical protein ANANG_G00301650 [Anguilla anguilla]|uniref:Myb/SANT-like DNA-binding domain-containing protein n=1 Tax=Anguilla anguilla TaxID=7936 RepID=A0A9D3LKP3_ANGAN|nr:hypothetical protein ANANG_G00301650 [Anguilla anguilla]